MGVGLRLKKILRDRKMTIKRLAEETGIPVNTLYSITKRDSERVDPVIIQKISEALVVSPAFLMGVLGVDENGNETIDVGLAAIKIGDILGVPQSVVYEIMKRLNITPLTIDEFDRIVFEAEKVEFEVLAEEVTQKNYLDGIRDRLQRLNGAGQQRVVDFTINFAEELAKIPEYQRNPNRKITPQAEAQGSDPVSDPDTDS